jgi:hypothetical protein
LRTTPKRAIREWLLARDAKGGANRKKSQTAALHGKQDPGDTFPDGMSSLTELSDAMRELADLFEQTGVWPSVIAGLPTCDVSLSTLALAVNPLT